MDLQVFSKSAFLQLWRQHILQLVEFKDHPAKPLPERSCHTWSKQHDKRQRAQLCHHVHPQLTGEELGHEC